VYPAAIAGALALAELFRIVLGASRRALARRLVPDESLAWAVVLAAAALLAPHVWRMPGQPPTVSEPLYQAGRWARTHLPAECVDYLVPNEQTAYWLHLAVLGSRRISERTADDRTFMPRDAIVRWIEPGGLPYAVADLNALPRDVRDGTDEIARFGSAVVISRRGEATCGP
jgi:hypothetical protein